MRLHRGPRAWEDGAKERLKDLQSKIDQPIIPISALLEEGIDEVLFKCADLLEKTPVFPLYDEQEEELTHKVYTLDDEQEEFHIQRLDAHTWRIEGDKIVKFYRMTNISTDEGMLKLMNHIRYLRIEDKLADLGAEDGHTIILDDFQFEYVR